MEIVYLLLGLMFFGEIMTHYLFLSKIKNLRQDYSNQEKKNNRAG